jgi:acyl-CoA thioesterase
MNDASDLESSADFLHLDHHGDSDRWIVPITPALSGNGGSLFGGVGLAAGIEAIERTTGRPVVWATGQYLAPTQPGEMMDLQVKISSQGHTVSHGRVVGCVGDREIITVLAAVGERQEPSRAIWARPVQVPGPDECEPITRPSKGESIHDHVERRIGKPMVGAAEAGAQGGEEYTTIWSRMPGVLTDPGTLAIMADHGPSTLRNALAKQVVSTSIDNTIRLAHAGVCDDAWVQLDSRIEFVGNGFAHGTTRMWNEEGRLLAIASQSMIIRSTAD